MKRILALIGLAFMAMAAGPEGRYRAADREGCEPGEPVGISARIVSIRQDGPLAEVLIETTISSRLDLASLTLGARKRPEGAGSWDESVLPVALVPRGLERSDRHTLLFEHGRDHDLLLVAVGARSSGEAVAASTYLRVPLDPTRLPRDLGDVLEFPAAARSGGRP